MPLKVNLNSLRFFSTFENKNAIVYDTVTSLMQVLLSEMHLKYFGLVEWYQMFGQMSRGWT